MQHINVLALELVQKYSDRELSYLINCIDALRSKTECKVMQKHRTRVEGARDMFPRLKGSLIPALKAQKCITNVHLTNRGGKIYLTVETEAGLHYDRRRQEVTNALCFCQADIRVYCTGWHVTSSSTTSTTFRMNPDPR